MPQQAGLKPSDYTVGWICALDIELAAAKCILDEKHSSLPSASAKHTNTYTFGRMGDHNVVIACLPGGIYGTSAAANVAVEMILCFESLRFGLMVGIGGGVPSARVDVRLGDVVVSQPEGQNGGVVQSDFGKIVKSGTLEHKGHLNAPPTLLLTAIQAVKADRAQGESTLPIYLSLITSKAPFVHDDPEPDVLFKANYPHETGEDCGRCNKNETVLRFPRKTENPYVHYGTIASGSQVIRDGIERDRLSSELGGESGVLCFEMEAAGLMNNFPCLVIRGICDYADTHKNKKWQPYAAATAAAYAKELLLVIPKVELVKLPTAAAQMTEFDKPGSEPQIRMVANFTGNVSTSGVGAKTFAGGNWSANGLMNF